MKYCTHCGKELVDEAVVCPGCGCGVAGGAQVNSEEDIPSGGLNVISFLLPMIGLVFYILYHETTPIKAATAGKWAAIGFGSCTLFLTILFLFLLC